MSISVDKHFVNLFSAGMSSVDSGKSNVLYNALVIFVTHYYVIS
jgi:hypothetical protein